MESLQLINTTPQQLADLIKEGVKSELQVLKKELLAKGANDDLLTREQAAEFLQINLSTLWAWQQKGRIKAYGISGHRRYYKRSELLEALQLVKK
ncbi:MAG: helix-turn-helix domain-containing protein [Bacteroidota bacterium]